MRVIVTGTAGQIGSQIVEELAGAHVLCLIDRVPVPEQASIIADLTRSRSCVPWRTWLSDGMATRHGQKPPLTSRDLFWGSIMAAEL